MAVVALAEDSGATRARDIVAPALADTHADRLRFVTIEDILDVTEELAPELSWWVTSFRRRYVDHTLPTQTCDRQGRDPLGPVMGRSIADTAAAARRRH